MDERDQVARTMALNRRSGMSEERREALNEFNRQAKDWRATCRLCGARLHGTIEEIKSHACQGV